MALKRTNGRQNQAIRVLLYGVEKIGKSSFAIDLPNCLHVDTERGTGHLDIEDRVYVDTWGDFLELLDYLETRNHDKRWLCIDTVDALEQHLWNFILREKSVESMADIGYGKGYSRALDYLRKVWRRLDVLRASQNVNLMLIGHALVKPYSNPVGEDYDRYVLKLYDGKNSSAAGFIKEQMDIIAFANYEQVMAVMPGESKQKKTTYTGARQLHLQRAAAYDAGSRFPLPDACDFSWPALQQQLQKGLAVKPGELRDAIARELEQLEDKDTKVLVDQEVKKAKNNTRHLSQILDRIRILNKEAAA